MPTILAHQRLYETPRQAQGSNSEAEWFKDLVF